MKLFHPRRIFACLVILCGCMLLLGACSAPESNAPASEGDAGGLKTVTMPWPKDVGPLNPHLYEPNMMFAQAMVYESLVTYGEDGEIKPGLAESWDVSEDGLTYTFHLRPDVVFSDGSPFGADQVVRNFEAILANKQRHSWMGIVKHIDKMEKVDDHTVRLKLTGYYYPALNELSFARPFRILGDAGFPEDGRTSEKIAAPIGTGPWILSEHKKDEYAVFTRNERYWGEKPKVDRVVVKVMPDSESIALAFEKGELDLIYGRGIISLDSFDYLKKSGKYGVDLSQGLTTRTVVMNTQKGPTAELEVRRAIQHAIDKERMLAAVTKGTEVKADTLLGRNIPYADIDLAPFAYDAERAEQLLEQAGWMMPPGGSVREKNGQPLVVDFVYISVDAVQKQMAEIMQGELAKVGIQVRLQGTDVMVGHQMLKEGKAHLNFWSSYGPPNDPHNFVTVSSQPSASGIYEAQLGLPNKAEIDAQIAEVLASKDETRRKQLYASILTSMHEQAVFYPISYETNVALYRNDLTGVEPTASKYQFPLTGIDRRP